MITRQEREHV